MENWQTKVHPYAYGRLPVLAAIWISGIQATGVFDLDSKLRLHAADVLPSRLVSDGVHRLALVAPVRRGHLEGLLFCVLVWYSGVARSSYTGWIGATGIRWISHGLGGIGCRYCVFI